MSQKSIRPPGIRKNSFVVYPPNGVGRFLGAETREVGGTQRTFLVIAYEKDRATVRVPVERSSQLRPLSSPEAVTRALRRLKKKPQRQYGTWQYRFQKWERMIASGKLVKLAEVVRDLYRAEHQTPMKEWEEDLFRSAFHRMVDEISAKKYQPWGRVAQTILGILAEAQGQCDHTWLEEHKILERTR